MVLLVVDARGDQGQHGFGFDGGQKAALVGGVRAGFDQQVFAVAGTAAAQVEAFVGFVEDENIGAGRAYRVAEEFVVALGLFVFGGEKKGARIGRPGKRADAFGGVREIVAGGEIAHVQGVLAEAGRVGGVGEQRVVGADGHGADRHEGVAFGKLVHVQQDLLRGVECGFAAAVDWVLQAFDGACGIQPAAARIGHRLIRLLDVRKHLGVQRGLELGGGRHGRGGVGVFGFEMGEQLG